MKSIFVVVCRVGLIAFCGFAAWRSVRLAMADWVASPGTLGALEQATKYAPNDGRLLARVAVLKDDDADLRRAAELDPFNSSVPMAQGLREEFRGNKAQAESDLARAAEIDHQFKPAWTLANYYFRTNQADKAWPMIERILKLEPLGYDPTPVFALCWQEAGGNPEETGRKILRLIPTEGERPVQYLAFLLQTQRVDAALQVWPEALAAANSMDVPTLTAFVDVLVKADRMQDAVQVWNQLVDAGRIQSGHLDPAKGVSIADPEFRFTPSGKTFDWRVAEVAGVTNGGFPGPLRFEFSGDEPQSFELLSTMAPVMAGTRYRLAWKSDGSDAGFRFRIVEEPGEVTTECGPLRESGGCDFSSPAGEMRRARIDLGYKRAQGTTRVTGALEVSAVRLEPAK